MQAHQDEKVLQD